MVKLSGSSENCELHFLVGIVAVPVHYGVHHAFPNGHTDSVQILFLKSRFPRQIERRPFRLIYTIQCRIEDRAGRLRFSPMSSPIDHRESKSNR